MAERSTQEEKAVLAVMQSLLDAVPTKDVPIMLENTIPSGGTARLRGKDLILKTIEELCKDIATIPGHVEERFIDPDVKIFENLAMVWAKNEVTIDGKVAMEGMNAISLHKIGRKWKITSISDSAVVK